jgi:hypothetical protein
MFALASVATCVRRASMARLFIYQLSYSLFTIMIIIIITKVLFFLYFIITCVRRASMAKLS